jgi:hypothetical protein
MRLIDHYLCPSVCICGRSLFWFRLIAGLCYDCFQSFHQNDLSRIHQFLLSRDNAMSSEPQSGNLIPPPDLAAGPPANTTPEQRIAMWFDLVDATDEVQLALLRARYSSEAEVMAAYRESYAQWAAEHDRRNLHMLEEFNRRCPPHGR